jgi:hypothetical protein
MVHFLDLGEFHDGLSLEWKEVDEDIFLLLIHSHRTPLIIKGRCGCERVRFGALLCFGLLFWIDILLPRADG